MKSVYVLLAVLMFGTIDLSNAAGRRPGPRPCSQSLKQDIYQHVANNRIRNDALDERRALQALDRTACLTEPQHEILVHVTNYGRAKGYTMDPTEVFEVVAGTRRINPQQSRIVAHMIFTVRPEMGMRLQQIIMMIVDYPRFGEEMKNRVADIFNSNMPGPRKEAMIVRLLRS